VVAVEADVRVFPALRDVVDRGVDQFGHIDVVCANARISNGFVSGWELDEAMVRDVIDIDLVGLWKTTTVGVPAMIDARRGGSIILSSSVAGVIASPNLTHYNPGSTWIHCSPPPRHLLPIGTKFLVFEVDDLGRASTELEKLGVRIVWREKEIAPGWVATAIRDFDGNLINIFRRH
jgi:hypothetical protein